MRSEYDVERWIKVANTLWDDLDDDSDGIIKIDLRNPSHTGDTGLAGLLDHGDCYVVGVYSDDNGTEGIVSVTTGSAGDPARVSGVLPTGTVWSTRLPVTRSGYVAVRSSIAASQDKDLYLAIGWLRGRVA